MENEKSEPRTGCSNVQVDRGIYSYYYDNVKNTINTKSIDTVHKNKSKCLPNDEHEKQANIHDVEVVCLLVVLGFNATLTAKVIS